jgi:outer membrane immunogenic protein
MKRILYVAASALAVAVFNPATAAESMDSSWTGLHAAVTVGDRWTDAKWKTTSVSNGINSGFVAPLAASNNASLNSSSFTFGVLAGYDWQVSSNMLLGFEGNFTEGNNRKTIGGIPGTFPGSFPFVGSGATLVDSASIKTTWDASLRGRFGVAVSPAWLLYATARVSWQPIKVQASCDGSFNSWCFVAARESTSQTKAGWMVGAGVETILSGNWRARAEYVYTDAGNVDHTFFPGSHADVIMRASVRTHTVQVGLVYAFGTGD